jgi:hypothetical protein
MSTSPIVVLVNQDALTIKADATFALTTGTLQSFSDLTDLADAVPQINPYATLEPDFWLLDGNYKIKPSTAVRVGLMTTDMSSDNVIGGGDFDPGPILTITFGSVHSTTNGLTLYFSEYTNDWCTFITVAFYDAANALIRTDNYTPTSAEFSTNQAVSDFKKITIKFVVTNGLYRYARLTGIDFDDLVTWSGSEIKAARVVESINPLSVELPMNTMDLTLFSADGDFSIVDPAGLYANLQYKEPLDVYENLNGEIVYIGRFYLDEWESQSENLAVFKAFDAIGILEGLEFMGGWWTYNLSGQPVIDIEDFLDRVFEDVGFTYELDASFSSAVLNGYLPITTCREALQQALISLGAYATCARSSTVLIKPFELASDLSSYDYVLTGANKGLNSPVNQRPLVTGVEVVGHVFQYRTIRDPAVYGSDLEVIFSQTLTVGQHKIIFDKAYASNLVLTGATVVEPNLVIDQAVNYLIVSVAVQGTVTIEVEADTYDEAKKISVLNPSLPASSQKNIIQITNANFVFAPSGGGTYTSLSNYGTVAQRVYDYYEQRHLQETKLFGHPLKVGDSVLISTQSSRQIKGIVERMTTDLAGGFVSDVEIIGVVVAV